MGLIKDDHIPAGAGEDLHDVLLADEIDGGNNAVVVLEDGGLGIKRCPVGQNERDVELDSHFVFLPLLGKTARGYDEHSLHALAHKQLFQQQARHNGLAGTGIVCK